MKPFNKRYYRPGQLLRESWELVKNWREMKELSSGRIISRQFMERIMLAVTGVNGCRYCTWAHTRFALKAGVKDEEIRTLLESDFSSAPGSELPALAYAEHWADTGGNPDPEAYRAFREHYDGPTADAVELAMEMIRWGNLSGNLLDYILYRLTFGRLGR